ncbi:hypothetical protein AYO38_04220 [bacterium SCGC AG-212-C10]|nr:hypothetical protein AYO38_04220 [bacterium SCGC AG-212-C10]
MPNKLTIEQVMAELSVATGHLTALSVRLTPSHLLTAPAPGEWSFAEVFAHLRGCADVWGDAIQRARDAKPSAVARDGRETLAWMKGAGYVDEEFSGSLTAFSAQRAELLGLLAELTPQDWARSVTVRRAGKLREESVLSYAQHLTGHELRHRGELERLVKQVLASELA